MRFIFYVMFCFSFCALNAQKQKPLYVNNAQMGKASFYGSKFEGRKTSNGEIFGNTNLTAAHKTLPMNSIVRVTVQQNRRYVYVRINDRGPFVKGRIIDLTDAATIGLDFAHAGTEDVEVRLCEEIQLSNQLDSLFNNGSWHDCVGNNFALHGKVISVGFMLSLEHALYIANDLYDDSLLHDVGVKKISVGPFSRYMVVISNLKNDDELNALVKILYGRGYVNAKRYSY